MSLTTKACTCVYKDDKPHRLCLRHADLRKDLRGFAPRGSTIITVKMYYSKKDGPFYGVICVINGVAYNKTSRIGDLISHHVKRDKRGHIGFKSKNTQPAFIAECVSLMLYGTKTSVAQKTFDSL
jgi:hypothetical protein